MIALGLCHTVAVFTNDSYEEASPQVAVVLPLAVDDRVSIPSTPPIPPSTREEEEAQEEEEEEEEEEVQEQEQEDEKEEEEQPPPSPPPQIEIPAEIPSSAPSPLATPIRGIMDILQVIYFRFTYVISMS